MKLFGQLAQAMLRPFESLDRQIVSIYEREDEMQVPDASPDLDLPLNDPRHPLNRSAVSVSSVPLLTAPKKKFYIVGGVISNDPIALVMYRAGWDFVNDYKTADAVIFPGGADVSPDLYKDPFWHPTTHANEKMDAQWQSIYGHIRSSRWLKIGICRGAQFLNVMNGGRLWQNVDKHTRDHEAIYVAKDGAKLIFDVTSTHHQMMQLGNWAELWGYADEATIRDEGKDRSKPKDIRQGHDPEVVYYSNTRTLCFQPHPEYNLKSCEQLFSICLKRAVKRSVVFYEPKTEVKQ